MNDYFVGIEFKGTFSDKDSKLIKNYYNLVRCDVCTLDKIGSLSLWVREKSVVESFTKIAYILKVLVEVYHLKVIDCEVNKF